MRVPSIKSPTLSVGSALPRRQKEAPPDLVELGRVVENGSILEARHAYNQLESQTAALREIPLVDVYLLQRGPEGPVEYLQNKLTRLTQGLKDEYSSSSMSPDELRPFLDHLAESPAQESTVRIVTHLWTTFLKRSQATLDEDVRADESPEQDLEMASACETVLAGWQAAGELSVRGPLGLSELREVALQDRIPVVGTQLQPLEIRGSDIPQVEALWNNQEGAWELLEDQANRAPETAAAVVGAFLDRVDSSPREESARTARLLQGPSPALQAILRPHIGFFSQALDRAAARGELDTDGPGLGATYEGLIDTFPETLTEELLSQKLVPMLLTDNVGPSYAAAYLLGRSFRDNPELIDPVMTRFTAIARPTYLREPISRLLSNALAFGWNPGEPEREWLTQWLDQPPHPHGDRLMGRVDEFALVAKMLDGWQSDGKLPEDFSIQWRDGTRLPLSRCVLDVLTQAENDNQILDGYNPGEETRLSPAYRILCRDEELVDDLLDQTLAALQEAPTLESLELNDRSSLALLHCLPLEVGQAERLSSAMAGRLLEATTHRVYRRIVDRHRIAHLEQAPSPTTREALTDLLEINAHLLGKAPDPPFAVSLESYLNDGHDPLTWVGEPLRSFVLGLDAEERDRTLAHFTDQFAQAYQESGSLEELSVPGLVALQVLGELGLPAELASMVEADLGADDAWKLPLLTTSVAKSLRETGLATSRDRMKNAESISERLDALERALAFGGRFETHRITKDFCLNFHEFTDLGLVDPERPDADTLLALARQLAAEGDGAWPRNCQRLGRIAETVDGAEAAGQVYGALESEDPWELAFERVKRLLEMVDVDQALSVYRQAREADDWESGLRQAWLTQLQAASEPEAGGGIEVTDQEVRVGGVVVPRRQNNHA